MIHSQEIALRCAAALPKKLLNHRPTNKLRKIYHKPLTWLEGLERQLEACSDDEARRLIAGRSY
jgi:hypothetical protein